MWQILYLVGLMVCLVYSSNKTENVVFTMPGVCQAEYGIPGMCVPADFAETNCNKPNMRIVAGQNCEENYVCCLTMLDSIDTPDDNSTVKVAPESRQILAYPPPGTVPYPSSPVSATCGKRGAGLIPNVPYPGVPTYPGVPSYPGPPIYPGPPTYPGVQPYPTNPNIPNIYPPVMGELPIIPRIAGGAVSNENDWCWQVAIMDLYGHYICGGVLVAPNFVLTSAHCVEKNAPMKIRLGDSDLNTLSPSEPNVQEARVYKIIRHPYYNRKNLDFDVALLQLTQLVQLTGSVCLACLPPKGTDFYGQNCIVTGYGKRTPNENFILRLKELALPIISYSDCELALQAALPNPYFKLARTAFCAGGNRDQDACEGDGGSPLVCADQSNTYYIAGLVSWGVGCGRFPGVYTAVPLVVDWISAFISAQGSQPGGDGYPQPIPYPQPQPNPTYPQPQPVPYPQPNPYPQPQPNPYPLPQPNPYPLPQPNPYPQPQPNPYPQPQPNPFPLPTPPNNDGSLPIVPRNKDA